MQLSESYHSWKPCTEGLRYPIQNILELLATGMTNTEILEDYEDLKQEDLQACSILWSR